ncbi:MAG TPA: helix-turn-helix transcriptional regulator [Draconibacterium sp.]|nr:helix-turn-helix transcriptional regulator [Draconibacterium sp.]
MATSRCKTFVEDELNKLGIYDITVELGEVELRENISADNLQLLNTSLKNGGLEIIEDKIVHLIKEIKAAVNDLVNQFDDLPKPNYSEYISQKVNFNYTHLSSTFSKDQGISIEKYIIAQRIERVKELLVYTDLGMTDISFKLHFSSVAHLSNQFKKLTGLTPSYYREKVSRNNTNNQKRTLIQKKPAI